MGIRDNKKEYLEYCKNKHAEYRKKNLLDLFDKENVFSKSQYKYKEKIIEYSGSKNGLAYIGLAKSPLMPNDNGIGFKGVKLQSPNRELIQCSECGEWMKSITGFHLKKHNLTTRQYKEKFGHNNSTALQSDMTSNFFAEKMSETNILHKEEIEKSRKRNKGNLKLGSGKRKNTMESMNNVGMCPEQLKEKVKNYIIRFRRLPYRGSGRDSFEGFTTLKRRHNGLIGIYKHYGLPIKKLIKKGVYNWEFPDGFVLEWRHRDGYEELISIIEARCELFKQLT